MFICDLVEEQVAEKVYVLCGAGHNLRMILRAIRLSCPWMLCFSIAQTNWTLIIAISQIQHLASALKCVVQDDEVRLRYLCVAKAATCYGCSNNTFQFWGLNSAGRCSQRTRPDSFARKCLSDPDSIIPQKNRLFLSSINSYKRTRPNITNSLQGPIEYQPTFLKKLHGLKVTCSARIGPSVSRNFY